MSFFHFILVSFKLGFRLEVSAGPNETAKNNNYFFFESTYLVLYIADIVLNFRTTYYDKEGDEIVQSKLISIHYIQGSFMMDFLATFPFHFFSNQYLQLGSLIKLFRIARIRNLIKRLNLSLRVKLYFKIILFIVMLPFIFHIMACTWHAVSAEKWISPIFWLDPLE